MKRFTQPAAVPCIATMTLLLVAALLLTGSSAQASTPEEEKQQLQQRFEQRYPAILQAKKAGSIGETTAGLIEAVKPSDDAALNQLIGDENADRTRLYALIAKSEGISAEQVASRAAKRNFDRAAPGDWLKIKGQWRQK